jgi:hypothetical protein
VDNAKALPTYPPYNNNNIRLIIFCKSKGRQGRPEAGRKVYNPATIRESTSPLSSTEALTKVDNHYSAFVAGKPAGGLCDLITA